MFIVIIFLGKFVNDRFFWMEFDFDLIVFFYEKYLSVNIWDIFKCFDELWCFWSCCVEFFKCIFFDKNRSCIVFG